MFSAIKSVLPQRLSRAGGVQGGGGQRGQVLSQDIPHIPSLLLRLSATNPASKRPASAERLLPTLTPTQEKPSSRTPKQEATGRTLYCLLSSGALLGGGWRGKESLLHPDCISPTRPHSQNLLPLVREGQQRWWRMRGRRPQGITTGHLEGNSPLLRAMSGKPLVCRSKPEGSPRRVFQLRGAPQSEGHACPQEAQSLMRETPHKDSREEAVLSLTYANIQIKTWKFKGKAL